MCSPVIVCVFLPRFELVVAAGDRESLLQAPAALAPEPGREQLVGEVSHSAEAYGIHPGMRVGEPVSLLRLREPAAELPQALERFGITTLGELAALPRAALADRFGPAGLLAYDLAHGRDTPLVPRRPRERLEEVLELDESSSGAQLERALGLLVDRLLARRERRGRALRAVVLAATLVE